MNNYCQTSELFINRLILKTPAELVVSRFNSLQKIGYLIFRNFHVFLKSLYSVVYDKFSKSIGI